jgi:hypothetical protein
VKSERKILKNKTPYFFTPNSMTVHIPSDHYYKQKFTFEFIEKIMYLVYIIEYIHYFFNKSKQ